MTGQGPSVCFVLVRRLGGFADDHSMACPARPSATPPSSPSRDSRAREGPNPTTPAQDKKQHQQNQPVESGPEHPAVSRRGLSARRPRAEEASEAPRVPGLRRRGFGVFRSLGANQGTQTPSEPSGHKTKFTRFDVFRRAAGTQVLGGGEHWTTRSLWVRRFHKSGALVPRSTASGPVPEEAAVCLHAPLAGGPRSPSAAQKTPSHHVV